MASEGLHHQNGTRPRIADAVPRLGPADSSSGRDLPTSAGAASRPALSVVVPVYNEEGNAVPLFKEIREVMTAIGRPFEIIFVNDGSTDHTLSLLREQAAQQACLRVIDFEGNFGEAGALCAGFQAARGEVVISLDGDGQNDPHDIPTLLATFERHGCRVVSGWRQERQEGFVLRVLPSVFANRLIAFVSGVPVHDNGCGLKVYRREVVATAALPRGMNRFIPAIFGVKAGEVMEVPVNDRRRAHGTSHYGLSRTFAVLRDLLALRFLIANPQRTESVAAGATVAAALVLFSDLWWRSGAAFVVAASVLCVASTIWWNARRYNRARAGAAFRIRCEYARERAQGHAPMRALLPAVSWETRVP